MNPTGASLWNNVRGLSPRSRRWRRFLHELPIDPDTLPRPLAPPSSRDFIICGSARSGTSLLSAALFQPPHVVTVMEPWDGMKLPPQQLFASLRREIAETGHLARGRLDVAALSEDGSVSWTRDGQTDIELVVEEEYLLGVKWPVFWRYLDLLPDTKFLVCVRDPAGVINSFKKAGGRVALGLHYDTAFNRTMNRKLTEATRDPALRRVLLYDYIYRNILPHLGRPNVLPVRYERWFQDPETLTEEIARFLGAPMPKVPVTVRPPKDVGLSQRELDLIRHHCETADELGYSLDELTGRRHVSERLH